VRRREMIKLIIGDETPSVERTIHFEFRRHANVNSQHLAYLVGTDVDRSSLPAIYPVKIDGAKKVVEIRRRDFEALGFTVDVRD
jgi:hypothetical protein